MKMDLRFQATILTTSGLIELLVRAKGKPTFTRFYFSDMTQYDVWSTKHKQTVILSLLIHLRNRQLKMVNRKGKSVLKALVKI